MAFWLFKQEPDCYSYADLERDGVTTWDGVKSPLAQKHLRAVKPGDKVFFYHTGDEKAIVGTMTVSEDPALVDEKHVVVQVKALKKLKNPVTLAAIKADKSFADWELVRQSRLSVMPVSAERWKQIEAMSKSG
jgi:predicted RNA-binding protein with PUA-like domain